MIPEAAYFFSIAGLSVTLAGFSGLVTAFRRGGAWRSIDSFRLRQIPEMGLATALVALLTLPLVNTIGDKPAAFRLASGLALTLTLAHVVVLVRRARQLKIAQPRTWLVAVSIADLAVIGAAGVSLILGQVTAYEWLLLSMLARPMLAFVLVLSDLSSQG